MIKTKEQLQNIAFEILKAERIGAYDLLFDGIEDLHDFHVVYAPSGDSLSGEASTSFEGFLDRLFDKLMEG